MYIQIFYFSFCPVFNFHGHSLILLFLCACYNIQALQIVELDQKIRLVSELEGSVLKCICDQNCNHVIQKCIECLPERNIEFIMSSVKRNIRTLAIHPYGCRVVQVFKICKFYRCTLMHLLM